MKKRRVDSENRVIGHIDLDCFYVQVERSLNPSLKGHPVAVVQCKIISLNSAFLTFL